MTLKIGSPLFISVLVFLLGFQTQSAAKTWEDDFNDGNLNGWTNQTPDNEGYTTTWEVQNGRLHGHLIRKPAFGARIHHYGFLEFTSFPLKAPKLNVRIHLLTGDAKLLLGRPRLDRPTSVEGYLFRRFDVSHWSIVRSGGGFHVLEVLRELDAPTGETEVRFDTGHFEVFVGGKTLNFIDETFPSIQLVGIVIGPSDSDIHVQLDDFGISAPGELSITARKKLAIAWGRIKNP